MFIATAPPGSDATPGDPVFRAGSEQTAGNVVLAARTADGLALLVSVATDAFDSGVTLGQHGPPLELSQPPYSPG